MAKELPGIALPKKFYILGTIPVMASGKVNFREVEKICRTRKAKKTLLDLPKTLKKHEE